MIFNSLSHKKGTFNHNRCQNKFGSIFGTVLEKAATQQTQPGKFLLKMRLGLFTILVIFNFLSILPHQAIGQQPLKYGNEWIDFSKNYFKFPVTDNRFFRIPLTTLQNAGLGNTPAEHFQLWRDGQEVPIFTSVPSGPLPTGGFIEFIGQFNTGFSELELYNDPSQHTHPERSHFNDTAWYYLTFNSDPAKPNKRFQSTENEVSTTNLPADSFYMHRLNPLLSSNNRSFGFARVIGGDFISSSNWDIGESFSSNYFNGTNRVLEYNLTGLRAFRNGPQITIEYSTAGNTATSRDVRFLLNNQPKDSVYVEFFNLLHRKIEGIETSAITNDAINLKFLSSNPIWFENVTVNKLLISYPRMFFHNFQTHLEINLPSSSQGNHLKFASLPNAATQPVLYDITNLKRYLGNIRHDTSSFLLEPSVIERKIFVGTQVAGHLRNITSLTPVNFIDYKLPENQSNYIIITHRLFHTHPSGVVQEYMNYRNSLQGGNYKAQIHDIDDLADQFAYGNRKNPLAIRKFILHAVDNYAQKPKAILLIGRGTMYTPFRFLALGNRELLNAVPTYGMPASDNLLATRDFFNPVPEVPIGRISAISTSEIKNYLDKLIEFESLQNKRPGLPSNNDWRKKITLLVGGDDVFLAENILGRFMQNYASILSAPKVGANTRLFLRANNQNYASDMKEMENRISDGNGVITYFGHSSTSSIDFNLGSPDQFTNTAGKYPVFIANGCRAGNIFDASPNRLTASAIETSISENFILAPKSGSIAFLSNSDLGAINYQNLLTTEWYRLASGSHYGKTIGEIQQAALQAAFNRTGPDDFLNRCNIEQNVLHGDPAIRLFPLELPDYAIETKAIKTNPDSIYTLNDSIELNIRFSNIGLAQNDSIFLQVERELPDGRAISIFNSKLKAPFNIDSIIIKVPIKGLFEEGNNFIIARIDPNNEKQEQDKDNNVAIFGFKVRRNHIEPTYPYNYAIVNSLEPVLTAQTTDPLEIEKIYTFQIDTTTSFNSPLLQETQISSKGGSISWQPNLPLKTNTVYYWRSYLTQVNEEKSANIYSFKTEQSNFSGFNQSHFYQHLNSSGDLHFDSKRQLVFGSKTNNLFVAHGVWGTSAFEETHLSMTHNGVMRMRSACVGRSIIFNVFNPVTFEPWRNEPGGLYKSAIPCAPGREYNFEYSYLSRSSRKDIVDFLEAIPDGHFVTARLMLEPPYDSARATTWMRDTIFNGSGISLYHSLKNQGFADLDSMNRPRMFFFAYKKNDTTTFKPYSKLTAGLFDRLFASVFPTTPDTVGTLTSPWIGPAAQWQTAKWSLEKDVNSTNDPDQEISIWGKSKSGNTVLLQTVKNEWEFEKSIADIDAAEYPYLQYSLKSSNNYENLPAQLNYWRMHYKPLTDGAWSGRDHFVSNIIELEPRLDTLHLEMAFKNVGEGLLEQSTTRVYIKGEDNAASLLTEIPIRQINPKDTAIMVLNLPIQLPPGNYELRIVANEAGNPKEENYDNNLALLRFSVQDEPLPLQLLDFTARKDGKSTLLNWNAIDAHEVKSFEIQHSANSGAFEILGYVKPQEATSIASGNRYFFEYIHQRPAPGVNHYRLKILHKDGKETFSGIRSIRVDEGNKLKILPNPFNNYFYVQPVNQQQNWFLRVFDINGRIVKSVQGAGSMRIDLGNVSAGMYMAEWESGGEKEIIKLMKQ